ncbi:MAG: hypothetical protein KGI03_03610, partial [Patescibacteria group bacterium]|nr:hypothetical protein [Patescibacteria group bacterium]
MRPEDPIEKHFARLRPEQKKALAKLGIATIRDLLYHFPSRYERSGPSTQIATVGPGAEATLYGTIRKPETRKAWKSKRPLSEAWLEDESGRIKLMWFNQPYIAKTLADGMVVKVAGAVTGTAEKPYIANPAVEKSAGQIHASLFHEGAADPEREVGLYPIYPESQGISSLWFLHAVKKALESLKADALEDPLPEDIRARYKLPALKAALLYIHAPRAPKDAEAAKKRFAFEEVFALQLAL